MLCVVMPKESVSNLSGTESVWVVDARRAIPGHDRLGNWIPDWAASGSHSVSIHVRVRSM